MSNAQHGAAANVTGTRRHVVGVFLTWSWSQQPEGRACAASFAHVDTKGRTPYVRHTYNFTVATLAGNDLRS